MSTIIDKTDSLGRYIKDSASVRNATTKDIKEGKATLSTYIPTPNEALARIQILNDFRLGWQTMHLPRPEFNDMSLYQRHIIDMLAFNTYQENDGQPMLQDRLGGWKSNALRPVVRNKAISMGAHMTARILVPKIFAYDMDDNEQDDSAKVMSYLVDWAREQASYQHQALFRTLTALYSPISWGYSEYNQTYKKIKQQNDFGSYEYKTILDEEASGFQHIPMATDQVYFANFYEREAQMQDFVMIRRIISYAQARNKYKDYANFQHVKPGIVVVMDDANRSYYNLYDPHMRREDVEEVIYWRKNSPDEYEWKNDVKYVMVNGILLTEYDACNPRLDKNYPLDAFYYLPINERCIAGKSLVFAMQSDANLLNTQYQMINDGSYLNLFPPTITTGSDKIGADVIIPGMNLAFSEKDVQINPIRTASDSAIKTSMEVAQKIEDSVSESSQGPIQQGQDLGSDPTAYQISRIEQNAATVMGLSLKFLAQHAIQYGRLLLSDILQYQTIADASKIVEDGELVFKTFYVKEPNKMGVTNKIKFDMNLPTNPSPQQNEDMSFDILKEQGGTKSDIVLYKVNPTLFREYKYKFTIDADVLSPRSQDLERAMDLELYDRLVQNPSADTEEALELLLSTNPKTARHPDKYIKQQEPQPQQPIQPANSNSPMQAQMNKLPQSPNMPKMGNG